MYNELEEFIQFPIFFNLEGRKVVVIGGDKTAFQRVSTLLKTGANIHVITPWVCDELKDIKNKRLVITKKMYDKLDLQDAFIVLALTKDKKVDMDIFTECKLLGIKVNIDNDAKNSDFIFPAIISKNGCCVGISGNKKNQKFVRYIAEKIRNIFILSLY